MVNIDALNRVIEREGKNNEWFAVQLGLSLQGWLNKRNGKYDFTVTEATKFCDALELDKNERFEIFLR